MTRSHPNIITLTDVAEWAWGLACLVLGVVLWAFHQRWCLLVDLTFVSTSLWLVLTLGGFFDALISDEDLGRWLLPVSPGLLGRWLPCVLMWLFWIAYFVQGLGTTRRPKLLRVYLYSLSLNFFLLGCRGNARVRYSAIRPGGGRSCHWILLTQPTWIAVLHGMTWLLIQLYGFILDIEQQQQKANLHPDAAFASQNPLHHPAEASISALTTNSTGRRMKIRRTKKLHHDRGSRGATLHGNVAAWISSDSSSEEDHDRRKDQERRQSYRPLRYGGRRNPWDRQSSHTKYD